MAEAGSGHARPRHHRLENRFREFIRRLAEKCDDDEIFFMAGAIAFTVYWGALTLIVALTSGSLPVTLTFLAATAGSTFFSLHYAKRMVGWWDELRGLFALSRPGVRRIAQARQDLLVSLSVLLAR